MPTTAVPVLTPQPSAMDCTSSVEVTFEPVTLTMQTPTHTVEASVVPVTVPPEAQVMPSTTASPRRSGRTRKPVDRFQFTPVNGYSAVQHFGKKLIQAICLLSAINTTHSDAS